MVKHTEISCDVYTSKFLKVCLSVVIKASSTQKL